MPMIQAKPRLGISNILMRVGNGLNGGTGIHAHMYYGSDIYYVADDAKRQKITWIKTDQ